MTVARSLGASSPGHRGNTLHWSHARSGAHAGRDHLGQDKWAGFALTLDDGPDAALTPCVLEFSFVTTRATFFLIGSRVVRHGALARRLLSEGLEVGNRLWRDERAAWLTNDALERSLLLTPATLTGVGPAPKLMRPPRGW